MRKFTILQMLLVLLIPMSGCGEDSMGNKTAWYADSTQLYADFNLAVERARRFTIADANDRIFPVGEPGEDSRMNWITVDGTDMVLMVSFVSDAVYSGWKTGEAFIYDGEDPLWTAFAFDWEQHKGDFAGMDSVASHMRMVQMCGLRPDAVDDHMVFLYVERSKLMRPAPNPDPAITTFASMDCVDSAPAFYKTWYAANADFSYNSATPYPWTRLGYTYDWNTATSDYGVSEFIVPSGTKVRVDKIVGCWTWIQSL